MGPPLPPPPPPGMMYAPPYAPGGAGPGYAEYEMLQQMQRRMHLYAAQTAARGAPGDDQARGSFL